MPFFLQKGVIIYNINKIRVLAPDNTMVIRMKLIWNKICLYLNTKMVIQSQKPLKNMDLKNIYQIKNKRGNAN